MPRQQSVEDLLERIAQLVAERQALHAAGASRLALERNRRRIAGSQRELSRALIRRYLPKPVRRRAA